MLPTAPKRSLAVRTAFVNNARCMTTLRYAASTPTLAARTDTRTKELFVPSSMLFVPCHNAKALTKMVHLQADAFIVDLEDAVPPSKKAAARENLLTLAKAGAFGDKNVLVRINSPREAAEHAFEDLDLCGMIKQHIVGVCVPKAEAGDFDLYGSIADSQLSYWAVIETPRGVLDAHAMGGSGQFNGFIVGSNDLSADLKLPGSLGNVGRNATTTTDAVPAGQTGMSMLRVALLHSHSTIILAARAAGIPVVDGVYNDFGDPEGFMADGRFGLGLGFDGKTLIHPKQIAPCNLIFDPQPSEVEWAKKVIEAIAASGGGATVCDGVMVEDMHARRAREVLRRVAQAETRR